MINASGDEDDSRTASVGLQRPHSNGSSAASRYSFKDGRTGEKRARKRGGNGRSDVQDFVPKGGSFSAAALDADPDTTSSSGFSTSHSDDEGESESHRTLGAQTQPGSALAAINWNKGKSNAIRTTLGGRTSRPSGSTPTTTSFESVNEANWRSRNDSVSSDLKYLLKTKKDDSGEHTDGSKSATVGQKPYYIDDSDGSDSGEVSEGGDSIILNIGSRNGAAGLDSVRHSMAAAESDAFHIDTQPNMAAASTSGTEGDGITKEYSEGLEKTGNSKEKAFCTFSEKYSTSPSILADLDVKDLEIQARHFFYDRSIYDVAFKQPIACTECLQEGHLAIVCPTKECEHCGVWNVHESNFCPSWRRCQKCRERGHDAVSCKSALKGSAAETPCDYCGADTHLESECDITWKFPRSQSYPGPITVSISCSYCTSTHHLMGDCPSLPGPTRSTSWTLKGYEPSMVTNLNSVLGRQPVVGGRTMNGSYRGGMKIRGRAGARSPSPDSDYDMFRRDPISNRNHSGRPKIRFGSGIGKNRNLSGGGRGGGPPPRHSGNRPDFRTPYRDRHDDRAGPSQHRQQQRSLSPPTSKYADHVHNRKNHPPMSPNLGRGRGQGGGTRGIGRGGRRDAYRPPPGRR